MIVQRPGSMTVALKCAFFVILISTTLSCKPSGACGCCGCRAKAKARAVKTSYVDVSNFDEKDDGNIFGLSVWNRTNIDKGMIPRLTNPNYLFNRCCLERKLPAGCVQHCHFNTYEKSFLEEMFIGAHSCPLEYLPEMQFCAAQGMDHRQCCSTREVDRTAAGEKCLTFCDQRPDQYTPIDYSYAPCFEQFENMKRCFYDDIKVSAQQKFQYRLLN